MVEIVESSHQILQDLIHIGSIIGPAWTKKETNKKHERQRQELNTKLFPIGAIHGPDRMIQCIEDADQSIVLTSATNTFNQIYTVRINSNYLVNGFDLEYNA